MKWNFCQIDSSLSLKTWHNIFFLLAISTKSSKNHARSERKTRLFAMQAWLIAGSWNCWKHGGTNINVDYIACIINVLGAINNTLTFIYDLNYFFVEVKNFEETRVSFFLETKHKVFRFKTKPIPRMSVQDVRSSLKILAANAKLSVTLAIKLVIISEQPKIWGVFVFKFWGLRGLCFEDTQNMYCVSMELWKHECKFRRTRNAVG